MLSHLLKLTWKRKSRNLMLSLEIMLAFAIVFAIVAVGLRYWQLSRLPLGFEHDNVWAVALLASDDNAIAISDGVPLRMLQAVQAMPEVEQAAYSTFAPFASAMMTSTFTHTDGSGNFDANMMEVSDGFYQLAGLRLADGRWPSAEDEGSTATAVVLNRRMAQELFPGRSALGQVFATKHEKPAPPELYKVVGLVDEFRNRGQLMAPTNFMLSRTSLVSGKYGLRTLLVKLRPGTPRAFEAALQRQLKLVRNDWGYRVDVLETLRTDQLREELTPLIILSVIAAFLLAMVAFGLFGVLWQNTTRRIPEIGLRRALGARASDIYRQIIAEQLLLSTLAMAGALVLLVQLPLTGALGESLNWGVFTSAAALSMSVIYLLSLACALYPGWRASRLHPAAALHFE